VKSKPGEWWRAVASSAPANLVGLWFGMTELVPGGWNLYVAGTATFDARDETAEWAVGPYAWWPDDRYFPIPEVEHLGVLEAVRHAAELVRSFTPWADMSVDGVAVGYDDGEFEVVFQR